MSVVSVMGYSTVVPGRLVRIAVLLGMDLELQLRLPHANPSNVFPPAGDSYVQVYQTILNLGTV
jgi:hypothetical protein